MFRLLFLGSYSLCRSHGWGISARAHVHTALLYLTNGSADCIQISKDFKNFKFNKRKAVRIPATDSRGSPGMFATCGEQECLFHVEASQVIEDSRTNIRTKRTIGLAIGLFAS